MKYFNSTKVADARKKIRAPFTAGYKSGTPAKRSYDQEKWEKIERAWNVSSERYAKQRLLGKLQYGDEDYYWLY